MDLLLFLWKSIENVLFFMQKVYIFPLINKVINISIVYRVEKFTQSDLKKWHIKAHAFRI